MIVIAAGTVAALAAVLHVGFFVMESIAWRQPRIWRLFGVRDQATADAMRPMAYNQGFYNLFLAIGAVIGLLFVALNPPGSAPAAAGRMLALFALGAMTAAAVVLLTTDARLWRAALVQGTLPLIGFVLYLSV